MPVVMNFADKPQYGRCPTLDPLGVERRAAVGENGGSFVCNAQRASAFL